MKKTITALALCAAAFCAGAQAISQPPSGGNQKSKVTQYMGPVEVSITYSSPDVHGPNGEDRKGHIWGELVPYGYVDQGFGSSKAAPWRAGANENTVITFSHDVKIEGQDLKAGSYGVFLATAKEGPWTWIFSKNTGSWGSYFYDQKEDALRVNVNPVEAPYTEWLTYGFDDRQLESTVAYLQWENKRIPFKISVPSVYNVYLSQIRDQLRSFPGFDYRNFSNAAQLCAQQKINLDEALTWANAAMDPNIGGKEEIGTLRAKADVLAAMGKQPDADAVIEKAIHLPDASVQDIHQFARGLLARGSKEKAMETFKYNAQKHPEDKFTTNVGLARGYTALGDKKSAIKHWEAAIQNIPENQKTNIKFYQGELDKLKTAK